MGTVHPVMQALRAARQARGLSIAKAAVQTGVPAPVIGSYERGDRKPGLGTAHLDTLLGFYGLQITLIPVPSTSEGVHPS